MPRLLVEGKAPGQRQQYGLPFQQFPAADLTPESSLDEQIQTGRQQIQDKYALQWKEVNRSKRFIGAAKSKRMLREIDAKAKQEMLQFNQQARMQQTQLNNINRLAEQGFIYNADELKVRMIFGSDVARSMYPERKSVEQQFSTLQIPLDKIEKRLAQFRRPKRRVKKWFRGEKKESIIVGELEIWDRSLTREVDGEIETGDWRQATQQEIVERGMLLQEQQRIKRLQTGIFGQPGVQRRIVQPGTVGGTFDDKIAESVKSQPTRRPKPKIIRQRNKRTGEERISYDGGRTWQTTG
jgi:hypothetical protein